MNERNILRVIIKGTNQNKLNTIKAWLETKIERADLHNRIGGGEVFLSQDIMDESLFVLGCEMYINSNVNLSKYKDIVLNKWQGLNKTGLTYASIIQYDNCSHDSDNPQPCVPITYLEWSA